MATNSDDLKERIHALETAQAAQTAQAGTWAVMAAGSASLIIGMFLGMAISKAKS
jgi:hypothetical protein